MTAILAITRVTIRQTLRLRRAIGLALLAGAPGGMYLLASIGSRRGGRSPLDDFAFETFIGMTVGIFMNIAVPVVTLIIATSVLGDERRDNTMSFLVLRPISRLSIGAAKVLAAFLEAFALTGFGAAVLGVVASFRLGTSAYLLPLVLGAAVATAAYSAVFVPLGYLLKRATLVGLTYVFIWENGIGGAVPAVASLSPWRIGVSAIAGLAPERFFDELPQFAIGSNAPGAGGAIVKAIVMSALSAAVVASILRRRDLAT